MEREGRTREGGNSLRGLEGAREGWTDQEELKRAGECCRWPGSVVDGHGGLERVRECWRGPRSVIEDSGVWNRLGRV